MNWVLLVLGLALIGGGVSFIGPHRRGVRHTHAPNPLFHVILYTVGGTVFVAWALIEWAAS